MKGRRWVERCRHCGIEHEAKGPKTWLRWYKEHLWVCLKWKDRQQMSILLRGCATLVGGLLQALTASRDVEAVVRALFTSNRVFCCWCGEPGDVRNVRISKLGPDELTLPVCSTCRLLLMRTVEVANLAPWWCPICSAEAPDGARFCLNDGTPRPESSALPTD